LQVIDHGNGILIAEQWIQEPLHSLPHQRPLHESGGTLLDQGINDVGLQAV
jgi:hypothetical protein